MVLSTLHTNDAPSTITRLLNMGIESFLVTASLNLVVAQRLGRRVCTNCAAPDPDITKEQLMDMGLPADRADVRKVMKGKGCSKCGNTGHKGRVGIYEVLAITDVIKEAILNGVSSTELKQIAIEEAGFKTMRASALNQLLNGITSVSEVLRVSAAD